MKRLEKAIWFGLIPAAAAVLVARRLARQLEFPRPAPEPVASAPPRTAIEDDLKAINGIGPVYGKRLKAAGVLSFAELAATSPQRLLEIVNATPGLADPDAWIAEARQRATSA